MEETAFHRLADQYLNRIAALLEDADQQNLLELEDQHGGLMLKLLSGKQLLLSKHTPMRQIWLASPISGGLHFSYRDEKWVLPDNRDLDAVLAQELKTLAQIEVDFE